MMYEDKVMPCAACEEGFVWTAGEQEFFESKGFTNPPKSCRGNRNARKAQRSSNGPAGSFSGRTPTCRFGEGVSGGPATVSPVARPYRRRSSPDVNVEDGLLKHGTISRVLVDRSFGFIRDDLGIEYYFHQDNVEGNFYSITEGMEVSFITESSPRGPRAIEVSRA